MSKLKNKLDENNIAYNKTKKGLEDINRAMEFAGRALGHRVWQSIENYMAKNNKSSRGNTFVGFRPSVHSDGRDRIYNVYG